MERHDSESHAGSMDPLTRVGNLQSFLDWAMHSQDVIADSPFTFIALHVNDLRGFNRRHGHPAGDRVLQWAAQVAVEETGSPVYRIAGDEFVVVRAAEDPQSHTLLAERLAARLNTEGTHMGLLPPVAGVAVIENETGKEIKSGYVLGKLFCAIGELKADQREPIRVFQAESILTARDLHRMVSELADRLTQLKAELNESRLAAHTDPLTELPNMRAAMEELETALTSSHRSRRPLAVLLIDGDALKRCNQISYSAGDKMIQDLGAVLHSRVRDGDFLARWRMGDEFLVIMPSTLAFQALAVAERIRSAVEDESQGWHLPITISVGVAVFPDHGETLNELLFQVEAALSEAKAQGKNRVVAAS